MLEIELLHKRNRKGNKGKLSTMVLMAVVGGVGGWRCSKPFALVARGIAAAPPPLHAPHFENHCTTAIPV